MLVCCRWPISSLSLSLKTQYPFNQSTKLLNILILTVITTIITKAKIFAPTTAQPRPIAAAPTPLFTKSYAKLSAVVAAVTAAVCCHNDEINARSEDATKTLHIIQHTFSEGNGRMAVSSPLSSISSRQTGNVANRQKPIKFRTSDIRLPNC